MRRKYLIVIFITFVLCFTGCSRSSSDIKHYLGSGTSIDSNAKDIMPKLDELPKYKSIAYQYTHKPMFIFSSDSVALIVNYDDNTYRNEKDKLTEKYVYLVQTTDFNAEKNKDIIPEYEFAINSYNFKVVKGTGKDHTEFPKSFGMIGTSDVKRSLAYLYFYDDDLDSIPGTMADFVKEYFKYEF